MPTGVKPPIPVGTAKVETLGTLGITNWANVMYYGVGTFDPAHLDDVVALLAAAQKAFYHDGFSLGAFPNNWQVNTYKVGFRDAADSLYRATVADGMIGTSADESEGGQVSWLVNYSSNDPRRGGKPRQYVPGIPDELVSDVARLNSSYIAAVNGNLLTWLHGLTSLSHGTASGLDLLEMSFVDAGAYRSAAHTWPIRGIAINPVTATQRRRIDRLRP